MIEKIGIVGSGISGLVSAYLLSQRYDVYLFEANDYIGGHTCTMDVPFDKETLQLDTGFIVFNKKTYPNFVKILEKENIPIQPSEMSFSYESSNRGFSYNGHSLTSLFADHKNIYSLKFYHFLANIIKFNFLAKKNLKENNHLEDSVNDFLNTHSFGELFKETYLKPMAAAIWSCPPHKVLDFPLQFLFGFLENHGLLNLFSRPQWYVLQGGSKSYINALTKKIRDKIYLSTPIRQIIRKPDGVILVTDKENFLFDKIVIATHSDTALKLLEQPTQVESSILSAITYHHNNVILHHDSSVLPTIKRNWASWNFFDKGESEFALTYYLNRLQNLKINENFCVSVNLANKIDKSKIIKEFSYSHPNFSREAIVAQKRHGEINGKNHTYYCGAYWGYGFHEDGVNSAIKACQPLKVFL